MPTSGQNLSESDKLIITVACAEENARQPAETNYQNGIYLNRLINEYGVELREFNDDVYEAFGEAATEVIEETRDHSALAKEIIDSFLAARNNVGVWTNYSDAPYVAKRNRFLGI